VRQAHNGNDLEDTTAMMNDHHLEDGAGGYSEDEADDRLADEQGQRFTKQKLEQEERAMIRELKTLHSVRQPSSASSPGSHL
jgi:hypothetical protein